MTCWVWRVNSSDPGAGRAYALSVRDDPGARTAFVTGMHPLRAGMLLPQRPGATSTPSALRAALSRDSWFYFTEDEPTPGAARVGNYKAVFNLRGDDGQQTGSLAVDSNLGWHPAKLGTGRTPNGRAVLAVGNRSRRAVAGEPALAILFAAWLIPYRIQKFRTNSFRVAKWLTRVPGGTFDSRGTRVGPPGQSASPRR